MLEGVLTLRLSAGTHHLQLRPLSASAFKRKNNDGRLPAWKGGGDSLCTHQLLGSCIAQLFLPTISTVACMITRYYCCYNYYSFL